MPTNAPSALYRNRPATPKPYAFQFLSMSEETKLVPCRKGLADAPLGIVSLGRNCDRATVPGTNGASSFIKKERGV
jgi:hypothetical protein